VGSSLQGPVFAGVVRVGGRIAIRIACGIASRIFSFGRSRGAAWWDWGWLKNFDQLGHKYRIGKPLTWELDILGTLAKPGRFMLIWK
jgi:hypothetical protein